MDEEIKIVQPSIKNLFDLALQKIIDNCCEIDLEKIILYVNPKDKVELVNQLILKIEQLRKWDSVRRFREGRKVKQFLAKFLAREEVFEQFFTPNNLNCPSESLAYIFRRCRIFGELHFSAISSLTHFSVFTHTKYNYNFSKDFKYPKIYVTYIEEKFKKFLSGIHTHEKILAYQKYVKIVLNYALFLIYTGEFEVALGVLQSTKEILELFCRMKLKLCPQRIHRYNTFLLRHCQIQIFHVSNKLKRIESCIKIYETNNEFYDAARDRKRKIWI